MFIQHTSRREDEGVDDVGVGDDDDDEGDGDGGADQCFWSPQQTHKQTKNHNKEIRLHSIDESQHTAPFELKKHNANMARSFERS